MKLDKRSRRLALIVACALAIPFPFATPASAMGGDIVESRSDPGLDLPSQAKAPDAKAPAKAPVTATATDPQPAADAQPDSTDAEFARLSREADRMRRRAAEERRTMDELRELRTKDPAAFEKRVREENKKLDDQERARRHTTGVGGSTVTDDGGGMTDMLRKIAEGDSSPAPVESKTSAPDPVAPVATRPEDPGLPAPISAPVNLGNAAPMPIDTPVGLGSAQPLGASPLNPYGAGMQPMPWWQMFLMKLLEVCGNALSNLLARKLDGLQSDAKTSTSSISDPTLRSAANNQLGNAITEGWNGAGTTTSSTFNLPTSSTPIMTSAPISSAPISSSPVNQPLVAADGTATSFPHVTDPATGSENVIVGIPLEGLGGSP